MVPPSEYADGTGSEQPEVLLGWRFVSTPGNAKWLLGCLPALLRDWAAGRRRVDR